MPSVILSAAVALIGVTAVLIVVLILILVGVAAVLIVALVLVILILVLIVHLEILFSFFSGKSRSASLSGFSSFIPRFEKKTYNKTREDCCCNASCRGF